VLLAPTQHQEIFSITTQTFIIMTSPACCPTGSWPQLLRSREELNAENVPAPKGSILTIQTEQGDDLPIYFCPPSTAITPSKGAILVLPDIYSVRVCSSAQRSGDRIGSICDALADAGYAVALPSIFRDRPFDVAIQSPDDGDFLKFDSFAQEGGVDWFKSQNYDKVGPDVKACAAFLKEKSNGQAIGVLGFCYGTWLLSKASATGDVDFSCAVGCHPATILEQAVYGGNEVELMNNLKQPTKFLWAGNDSEQYIKDGACKKALEKTGGGVVEYADMLHGWVSRGDVSDEKVKMGVEKAINDIMDFFEEKMPK
jgi:dienelactone hydrolase